VKHRHGFTLVETLLVVVIMGLVTLMVIPRLNSAFDRTGVLNAKARITALYSTARSIAISSNQTGILRVNGNQVYVYARPRRKAPSAPSTSIRCTASP
jgi:type II secretion system protein H